MQTANLEEVLEAITNARQSGQKVSLLIGAGCSVTAGIPVASGIVDRISQLFPAKYSAASALVADGVAPNYQQCMARLAPLERRGLMAEYVDKAKINWAHVGVACLIRAGIVDRVLTVNFDPLIIRACALLNEFPGIYDFAASQTFDASHVADRAVFYLHGQQSGFVQLHTKEQVDEHAKRLTPVFDDAGRNRLWIVVGYSGENDPVIENLAKLNSFANGLYWIGRRNSVPPESVATNLLAPAKSGFFVECAGADEFFLLLARQLACFPPPLLATPFSHLAAVYDTLVQEFPSLEVGNPKASNKHPLEEPRNWISDAIARFEETIGEIANEKAFVLDRYLAGDYDAIIEMYKDKLTAIPVEVTESVVWSFISSANALGDEAVKKSGKEADQLFERAKKYYEAALTVDPRSHNCLYNWGVTLSDEAGKKSGSEADQLLELAGEKYSAACSIVSDNEDILYNWGVALGERARLVNGKKSATLIRLAIEKFESAHALNPKNANVLTNWGVALGHQAEMQPRAKAKRLLELSVEKFEAALQINPNDSDTLFNWGNAVVDMARGCGAAESDRLLTVAGEKFAACLKAEPARIPALFNWANILGDQAMRKSGGEAERLFELASEKYASILALDPSDKKALYNWSITLADHSKLKTGKQAKKLLALSKEKRDAAIALDTVK